MNIKLNEFGEVMSVNGLTTGQRLGTPMPDGKAERPEHNQAYSEEAYTVTRVANTIDDTQPKKPSTSDIPSTSRCDNSVWVEKESVAVFDKVVISEPDLATGYPVYEAETYMPFHLTVDDAVTIIVNGVSYTPTLSYYEEDGIIYSEGVYDESGNDICPYYFCGYDNEAHGHDNLYEWYISIKEAFIPATVSVIVEKESVKTNCDFMIKADIKHGNDPYVPVDDTQLVFGDFSTAKAKIQKGLPVSAFVSFTYEYITSDGDIDGITGNNVCGVELKYYDAGGTREEILLIQTAGGSTIAVFQDNTVEFDY